MLCVATFAVALAASLRTRLRRVRTLNLELNAISDEGAAALAHLVAAEAEHLQRPRVAVVGVERRRERRGRRAAGVALREVERLERVRQRRRHLRGGLSLIHI